MPAPPLNSSIICLNCGYQLRSLPSNVCPECGRSFDPNDPSTFLTEGYRTHFARKATKPPGKPLLASTIIAATIAVMALSAPTGGNVLFFLASLAVAFFVTVCWSVRFLVAAGCIATKRAPRSAMTTTWRRWITLPSVFALVLALGAPGALIRIRFELSRAQLQAAATRVAVHSHQVVYDRMVGLYYVGSGGVLADGSVELTLPHYGWYESISFRYVSHSKPSTHPATQFIEIANDWYICLQD